MLQNKSVYLSALLTTLFLATSTHARTSIDSDSKLISIVASGSAAASPELVNISVSINSLCYDSPVAARNANAKSASAIFEKLKTFAKEDEAPTTSGVWIGPDERVQYVNNGSLPICPNGWAANQSISLSTRSIPETAEIQESLYELMMEINGAAGTKKSVTRMSMSAPTGGLSSETRRHLEQKAIREAIKNARIELDIITTEFQIKAQLVGYKAPGSSIQPEFSMMRSAKASSPDSPVAFDQVVVEETREFIFSFD